MNHDFRNRAVKTPNVKPIKLLGEGVFHQFHGGISTNAKNKEFWNTLDVFRNEYEAIHGKRSTGQNPPSLYFGKSPKAARKFLEENPY